MREKINSNGPYAEVREEILVCSEYGSWLLSVRGLTSRRGAKVTERRELRPVFRCAHARRGVVASSIHSLNLDDWRVHILMLYIVVLHAARYIALSSAMLHIGK